MMRKELNWQHDTLPGPTLKHLPKPESSVNMLQKLCTARSVFLTDTGHIGVGSEQLREGDELCVLNSGRVPYLMRSVQNGMYTLVGECCVLGMMKGEAVSDADASIRKIILV
jgi:hypothetical protein